jgi:hypothetical protein
VLWLLGFVVRTGEGASHGRWYRWLAQHWPAVSNPAGTAGASPVRLCPSLTPTTSRRYAPWRRSTPGWRACQTTVSSTS